MVGRRTRRWGTVSIHILLLVIVLASIATALCYRAVQTRVGTELRAIVQRELSELFPRADIFIGRVSFDDGGTIAINDLRMAAEVAGKRQQILSAEQVLIRGQFDISDFLKQTARVEEVHLFGLEVDAWPFEDGSWSIDRLQPRANPNRRPPELIFERSRVKIRQGVQESSREVVLHDVHGTVRIERSENLTLADGTVGMRHHFKAHASGRTNGLLAGINVECHFDSSLESINVTGNATGLHFSQRLLDHLPPEVSQKLTQLAGLECEASCSHFHITTGRGRAPEFSCQGTIAGGRLRDSRLPYPLEKISSNFFCKNSLLQLRNMSARSGGATLKFDTDIMGLGLDSPMVIHGQVQNLELDQRLYASLPRKFQEQWDRLQLSGLISGGFELKFDGLSWHQSASIDCQQVGIRPWLFPYPLTQVEGRVLYRNGTISSDRLIGRAGGQLVEASMRLKQSESQWLGELHCKSHGPVVIDQELISALTPAGKPPSGAETFVQSLHLSGAIELVQATFERRDAHSPKWNRTLDAHVYDGRLQYEKFPYPIYNIRGRILNHNSQWRLESFEGRNDSARILFTGHWQQVPQGSIPFNLRFEAFTVPLTEDLFHAVPQTVRNVWSHLQPTGNIGQIVTSIQRPENAEQIETEVTIVEQTDAQTQPGRSLRLYPHAFPYHLNDVNCHVVYRDQIVTIHRATAHNGSTRLALRGLCQPQSDGSWRADIQWLPTTRLLVDGQLTRALPSDLRESLQKLDFHGPVSVLGSSQVEFGDLNQKPDVAWDCQFDIEDCQLANGEYVNAMRGTIWAHGVSNNGKVFAAGQVSMDALRVLKIPVTNLLGPFAVVDNKLYFGESAQNVIPETSHSTVSEMTAHTLAGTLRLNGYSLLDTGKLHLDANLENADLSTLLLELGVPQQESQAVCNVRLKDFRGIPWNPQTFYGSGSIHLSDAKLYELPFMMRLLSVASVSANDASAFQNAQIDFSIDGDHIPLKVAADGEVLRVRGEGWTNLRRDVDLQLYTYVGRRLPLGPMTTPLLAESRFATFMMVEVTGSLDNPTMQRRPFPQIEATLQQIFPEVAVQGPMREAMNRWRN